MIDTFLETYHIRVLHPETLDWLIHSNVGTFEAFGRNSRSIYVRRSVEELRSVPESDWDLVHHTAIVLRALPELPSSSCSRTTSRPGGSTRWGTIRTLPGCTSSSTPRSRP